MVGWRVGYLVGKISRGRRYGGGVEATSAVGMHPTGMHSCLYDVLRSN